MHLSITTPTGSLVDTEIEEVSAPGVLGEFGILPGHIPFLSAVQPGVLVYRTKEGTRLVAVGSGFANVSRSAEGDRVAILVDTAVASASVNKDAAAKELAEIDAKLEKWPGELDGEHKALVTKRAFAAAKVEAATRAGQAH